MRKSASGLGMVDDHLEIIDGNINIHRWWIITCGWIFNALSSTLADLHSIET